MMGRPAKKTAIPPADLAELKKFDPSQDMVVVADDYEPGKRRWRIAGYDIVSVQHDAHVYKYPNARLYVRDETRQWQEQPLVHTSDCRVCQSIRLFRRRHKQST